MLRHLGIGELGEILSCNRSVWTSRQWHLLAPRLRAVVHPSLRWMSQTAAAQTSDDSPKRLPGTPAPGRGQTVGEEFDAMQYHGRGTRKIKSRVLHSILKRLSSEDELKYAFLGMELFKKQGIKLTTEAGGLFIKACCKAGAPQAAVKALGQAEKYGLDEQHVIGPNRFNFLLGHLYNSGDEESYRRAVADARSRGQVLNEQSHFLIKKFEAEVKARAEEEKAKQEAEEAKQDDSVDEEAEATSGHPQQSDDDQAERKP